MHEFVLLYRRPLREAPRSPTQMQQVMQQFQAWFKNLDSKGQIVSVGQPLGNEGAVVTDRKGSFNDGPYMETKDIVGGYSVIKAKDLQEAIALTKGHPMFDLGGVIEVRQVQRMP